MPTTVSAGEWAEHMRTFRRSAWYWEALPSYGVDYEQSELERYRAGNPTPPPDVAWWRPYLDQIRALTGEGKTVGRLRPVQATLSLYQRWQLWAARYHIEAGETILYMPTRHVVRLGIPLEPDWWLFDDRTLIYQRNDPDGKLTERIREDDPSVVAQYCVWRDLAIRNATPAEVFTAA